MQGLRHCSSEYTICSAENWGRPIWASASPQYRSAILVGNMGSMTSVASSPDKEAQSKPGSRWPVSGRERHLGSGRRHDRRCDHGSGWDLILTKRFWALIVGLAALAP